MTYYPCSNRLPESEQEATVGFPAAGLIAGGLAEVSGPIPFLTWGSPQPNINYALPQPEMMSNINTSSPSSQNFQASSGGESLSEAQVLDNLQGALQQLSAALSSYKSANSH